MKVLVADDDRITLRLLQALVTRWGHEAVLACDGLEAWQVLQSETAPRLALLDGIMTGMDGLEIIRKVREHAQSIRPYLIMLSGRDSQEDIVRGLEAGADDYLKKPIRASELRARIEVGARVLELQHSHADGLSKLQAALREHERAEVENLRLATAIEQTSEGVVITDAEGTIQYVNSAFTRMTGYSAEQVLGRSPKVLKSGQHDRSFHDDLLEDDTVRPYLERRTGQSTRRWHTLHGTNEHHAGSSFRQFDHQLHRSQAERDRPEGGAGGSRARAESRAGSDG